MKNNFAATVAVLAIVLAAFGLGISTMNGGGLTASANKKVTICHFPPGNPENVQILTVGKKAAEAHIKNHEGDHIKDYDGPCGSQPTTMTICHGDEVKGNIVYTTYIDLPIKEAEDHLANHKHDTEGECPKVELFEVCHVETSPDGAYRTEETLSVTADELKNHLALHSEDYEGACTPDNPNPTTTWCHYDEKIGTFATLELTDAELSEHKSHTQDYAGACAVK